MTDAIASLSVAFGLDVPVLSGPAPPNTCYAAQLMRLIFLAVAIAASTGSASAQNTQPFLELVESIAQDSVALSQFSDCYGSPLRIRVQDSTAPILFSRLHYLFGYTYDHVIAENRFSQSIERAQIILRAISSAAHDVDDLDSLRVADYSAVTGLSRLSAERSGPALVLTFSAPYNGWIGARLAETSDSYRQCEHHHLMYRGVNYVFGPSQNGDQIETLRTAWSSVHYVPPPSP